MIAIICLERGMPSRVDSTDRPDYVPALCTHCPSLLPIGWLSEVLGPLVLAQQGFCLVARLMGILSNFVI